MAVKDLIDLPHRVRDGYELEAFTVARDGLVYVPGKWVNWEAGRGVAAGEPHHPGSRASPVGSTR
jgi:hypothetical protein